MLTKLNKQLTHFIIVRRKRKQRITKFFRDQHSITVAQ
jgi:hypothetical protein